MPRAPSHPPPPSDAAFANEPAAPSKTQLKKQAHDLQELGEALSTLPEARLAGLEIEERLRDAIAELRRTRSHEGRRRQIQYIGKLMRFEETAPLHEAVASYRLGSAKDTLAMHEAEHWREQLIARDEAVGRWMNEFPDTDSQQLRSLVRSARKETLEAGARHGRAYRDLFQIIKQHMRNNMQDRPDDAAPPETPDHE